MDYWEVIIRILLACEQGTTGKSEVGSIAFLLCEQYCTSHVGSRLYVNFWWYVLGLVWLIKVQYFNFEHVQELIRIVYKEFAVFITDNMYILDDKPAFDLATVNRDLEHSCLIPVQYHMNIRLHSLGVAQGSKRDTFTFYFRVQPEFDYFNAMFIYIK